MAKMRSTAASKKTSTGKSPAKGDGSGGRGRSRPESDGSNNSLEDSSALSHSTLQLSDSERGVLAVFRKYLMTPGRMLCLNNTDIGSMKRALERLTAAGFLTPEDFKGSYSLTRSGFKAMNELG